MIQDGNSLVGKGLDMKRQKRPIHLRRKNVVIFVLCVLFSIFMTIEIYKKSPLLIGLTAGKSVKANSIYKIVIDAGHGGKDPGANGASGKEEKEYTLALSKKIYELLRQERMFEPYLTRTDDTYVALVDRAKFANELGADALISIHGNTFSDPEVSGTETYYYVNSSRQLAYVLHEHLIHAQGFRDRNVRKQDWKVLVYSEVPAVLVEIGYLTNNNEEAAMLDSDGQVRTAQAIVDGLKQYFTQGKSNEAYTEWS